MVIHDEQQHFSSYSVCIFVSKDWKRRPYPLLYTSSSIFALSSALISALISSKFTGGLAGSLSCSVTLFPLHCFRWKKKNQPWTPLHHNTVVLSCKGQTVALAKWCCAIQTPSQTQRVQTKNRSWQICLCHFRLLTEHLAQILLVLTCSLYNQDMIVSVCLDFVKASHKCLDYDPG